MRAPVDFDDIHFERRAYDPQTAYAQSKTANSLFAVEATRRWGAEGIMANAVNPGGVKTGLQRNFTQWQRESLDTAEAAGVFTYKTTGQGAATTLVAAVAPEFERTGGHYLDDCREAYPVPNDADLSAHSHGVKEAAVVSAAELHGRPVLSCAAGLTVTPGTVVIFPAHPVIPDPAFRTAGDDGEEDGQGHARA